MLEKASTFRKPIPNPPAVLASNELEPGIFAFLTFPRTATMNGDPSALATLPGLAGVRHAVALLLVYVPPVLLAGFGSEL
jgi:hypothetical protein